MNDPISVNDTIIISVTHRQYEKKLKKQELVSQFN